MKRDLIRRDVLDELQAWVGLQEVRPEGGLLPDELRPLRVPGAVVAEDRGDDDELVAGPNRPEQPLERRRRRGRTEPGYRVDPIEHLVVADRPERRRPAKARAEVVAEHGDLLGVRRDHELARMDMRLQNRSDLPRVLLVRMSGVAAPDEDDRDECDQPEPAGGDEPARA